MAITDVSEYQALVGRIQGAEKFYMKSGGQLDVANGAVIEVETTGTMTWASTSLEGRELELQFLGDYTVTQHPSADFSHDGGGELSPMYGFHVVSGATGISLGTLTMGAASKGARLFLDCAYLAGDGNLSVSMAATGAVFNTKGTELSSFGIAAAGYVEMVCLTDGEWQVVNDNDYTEQTLA